MSLTGIDAIVFGVADMDAAHAFMTDWGVTEENSEPGNLRFVTRDGGEVLVRRTDDPDLPAPMQSGPTLREEIWGVAR